MTAKDDIEKPIDIAIHALAFLADDIELMGRFLALTGISPLQIRAVAHDPAFLSEVLGFLVDHEPILLRFSAQTGLPPSRIVRAHARLAPPRPEI